MQTRLLLGWLFSLLLTLPVTVAAEPDTLPKVIGGEAQRQLHAAGDIIYVQGIAEPLHARFWLIRNDAPIQAQHADALEVTALGMARLVAHGKPATLIIEKARQEVRAGDRLIPMPEAQ